VLDDATSALDPMTERQILQALQSTSGDHGRPTVFIVTNRPSTLESVQRVFLLEHGRLAACGTHAELAASERTYCALMGLEPHDR
jgi:ATP-binding cassette subfamily B protein